MKWSARAVLVDVGKNMPCLKSTGGTINPSPEEFLSSVFRFRLAQGERRP